MFACNISCAGIFSARIFKMQTTHSLKLCGNSAVDDTHHRAMARMVSKLSLKMLLDSTAPELHSLGRLM
jgi:hypothetical protein